MPEGSTSSAMPPSPASRARPMRADARRSRERILAAAAAAIARDGAEASLEEIARRAGVGSATLHRHFPSRQALLEAVFRGKVEALCATALRPAAGLDPGAALVAWLRAVAAHAAANRGLAVALMRGSGDGDPSCGVTCHAMILRAGEHLMTRARQAGAVRPEIAVADLLKLVNAICLATEGRPDATAEADRLLTLAVQGVRPAGTPAS
ncbi:TetR/AcrR family transcriptional regulator [Sphaerisporangium perillae]|uniref:TetR/AcrR family transcriptional regulator n=1 Tax=Sphaerisporangium perillae TaxID=2935860 RepID=UPI00200D3505|nr:TetR/AcrR family transcriptional regulator [Sphaerisporangium perillae]